MGFPKVLHACRTLEFDSMDLLAELQVAFLATHAPFYFVSDSPQFPSHVLQCMALREFIRIRLPMAPRAPDQSITMFPAQALHSV